ncbi:PfkB family carbohydrate kinase [Actinomadura sp. 9N407]|uniref:PfkB family carbohydrate kinase n=1 Tax=Actinomadura sp. 9N407 TaxID=3375154 RepID=UPI003799107B
MADADVVVVGQVARDLVVVVDEVPEGGGSVPVRTRSEMLGGKGANQAVGLAQLGVRVALAGAVGEDAVAADLLAQAKADGIDTSHVVRRAGATSALIIDIVDGSARWRYLEDIPDETLVTEADIDAARGALSRARYVLVQLQQPAATALHAATVTRAAGGRVVLDGVPQDRDACAGLLGTADILRADAQETDLLAGSHIGTPEAAVRLGRDVLGRGPSLVALAVADQGNMFVWPDGELFLPLGDADVVDTTGAGDALVAALTASLLRGEPPRNAARHAVEAAAATVGHPGGRPALSRRRSPGEKRADRLR